MMVAMTKEEIEKLTRIKNRILDMLVISEDDAYNFAHTCLTCGLDFVKRKRTEADILNDFEKLGYKIKRGFEGYYKYNALILSITIPNYYPDGEELDKEIIINLDKHTYECGNYFYGVPEHITMQEHKLLSELFEVWRWI